MGAFFYNLASFLVNRLPLKFSFWAANRLGDIYYLVARHSRRVLHNNFSYVFRGEKSREERYFCIRQTFREFGKYLVEFFFFSSLNERNIGRFISVKNIHYVDNALRAGKGGILLTCHFGNWELGGIAMGLKGYPLYAVALDHRNKAVNRFFVKRRESKGLKIIPLGIAIRRCFEVLRGNGILALVGDRDFNNVNMGISINFCGRETDNYIPVGAAKLALKTGAKIIPTFVIRDKDNRAKLFFNKPLEVKNSGKPEEDVRRIMEDFFAIFEKFVKQYPSQWFTFYPLWKDIK